jgi:hypothetical protein
MAVVGTLDVETAHSAAKSAALVVVLMLLSA